MGWRSLTLLCLRLWSLCPSLSLSLPAMALHAVGTSPGPVVKTTKETPRNTELTDNSASFKGTRHPAEPAFLGGAGVPTEGRAVTFLITACQWPLPALCPPSLCSARLWLSTSQIVINQGVGRRGGGDANQ